MKKDDIKKLVALRREAIPHFREIWKLTRKAEKIMKDEGGDWAFTYIWDGGKLRWILRMLKLEKEKKFKELGKELVKIAEGDKK